MSEIGTTYRTTGRRTVFNIEITGQPLTWRSRHEGARTVLVDGVRLSYGADIGGEDVSADIVGVYLRRDGSPSVNRADDYAGLSEFWPDWLTRIADEHQPESYVTRTGVVTQ